MCAGANETGRPSRVSVSHLRGNKATTRPVVGQLVDTFTIKSVLSPDPACATSGQAETLKKLYAGDAAETVWGDQNLSNRAPR